MTPTPNSPGASPSSARQIDDGPRPGDRVRVTQQVPRRTGTLTTTIEGVVLSMGAGKTGSWFAHTKDGKLWLDRIELVKDNGERVVCNLDQFSRIERA